MTMQKDEYYELPQKMIEENL